MVFDHIRGDGLSFRNFSKKEGGGGRGGEGCDIKSEYKQKPCDLCQTYTELDALLHKAHSKVLLLHPFL